MKLRIILAVACFSWTMAPTSAQDANEADEAAMKAAVAVAARSVVKIETSGGREVIPGQPGPGGRQGGVRKGTGPTTGLVVGEDGWIISSSFNFADKPSSITVTAPGKDRKVAKIVGSDTTRMLTLLKIDATGLVVPKAFPKSETEVGRWSLALGRALDPDLADSPSISLGIISATGRIFGKCVQTDAKVSPVNYGGPLVALDGRVIGVLVPASPRGDSETAGVEWYDSGIGFAVPLDDIFAVLPKLKNGDTLRRGLMGISAKVQGDDYNAPPVIGAVSRDSAAEKAGIKANDTVVELDGKPIANFSGIQHALGPKYAGDIVAVKISRDGKTMDIPNVVLTGAVTSFAPPFLGILPLRDDPTPGVEIRYVYPKSPADEIGLKVGDRILKVAPIPVGPPMPMPKLPPGMVPKSPPMKRDVLIQLMTTFRADDEVELEVKRKAGDKTEKLKVKLIALPEDVAAAVPLPSSAKEAAKPVEAKDEKADKIETGLRRRTNPTLGRESWVFVPENYDKAVAHGAIIWLHRARGGAKDGEDLEKIFGTWCNEHHFILVGPKSKNEDGWLPSETEELVQELNTILAAYTIDKTRVVAHGMGIGGQMSYYLAFNARELIRGVAVTGAVLGTAPKEPVPGQPISFYIVCGEQDPLVKDIAEAKPKLVEKKYPTIYRQLKDFGKEYLMESTLEELKRWLDSLDRI